MFHGFCKQCEHPLPIEGWIFTRVITRKLLCELSGGLEWASSPRSTIRFYSCAAGPRANGVSSPAANSLGNSRPRHSSHLSEENRVCDLNTPCGVLCCTDFSYLTELQDILRSPWTSISQLATPDSKSWWRPWLRGTAWEKAPSPWQGVPRRTLNLI